MSRNIDLFGDTVIKYNSETGLYGIYKNNTNLPIVNSFRIYNNTTLLHSKDSIGYFYISPDNKYIYLDGSNPNLDIQYLYFSMMNPNVTNNILYDIYSISSVSTKKINNETYDQIQTRLNTITQDVMTNLKKQICISFAYELDIDNRKKQIDLLAQNSEYKIYNQYDCTNETESVINIEKYDISPTSSTSPMSNSNTLVCHSNNLTEYNTYYMYGLTVLNGLLILISIALILLVFDDKGKKEN